MTWVCVRERESERGQANVASWQGQARVASWQGQASVSKQARACCSSSSSSSTLDSHFLLLEELSHFLAIDNPIVTQTLINTLGCWRLHKLACYVQ